MLTGLILFIREPRASAGSENPCTAWRTDGRRIGGTLALAKGHLRFTSTEGVEVPLADISRIVFAKPAAPLFRVGGGRRVQLRDGQQITGQLLGLDGEKLTLRTAWAERLELPRAAVASLDSLPGWRTVIDDDFRKGVHTFTTIGQVRTHTLDKPLPAGRIGVNFREQGKPTAARWTLEMLFEQGERMRHIAMTVGGESDKYAIDTGGLKGRARSVKRTPGWHRLILKFSPRSLRITCDDDVLWYNLEQGPGGRLKQVSWHCHPISGDATEPRGAVAWAEFSLERPVDEHPKPPADTEQDAVRLSSDDQLFGRILQANRHGITIEGRFGKRTLPWNEVAGCSFQRTNPQKRLNESVNVRILLHSGLCSEADMLDGVVTALDDRRLSLRHALLGEQTFEHGRVRELQPLFPEKK